MKKRGKAYQVKIPKPLIFEVDKIVANTDLYSDKFEFITDAVRRLIVESKKEANSGISCAENLLKHQNQVSHSKNEGRNDNSIIDKEKIFRITNDDLCP